MRLLKTAIKRATDAGSDCSDIKANWGDIASQMKSQRTAKQCRDRWQNYLRPGIKKGQWTRLEEKLIMEMYEELGGK